MNATRKKQEITCVIAPEWQIGASFEWRHTVQWRQCEVGISGGLHHKIKTLMPSLWPNFRKWTFKLTLCLIVVDLYFVITELRRHPLWVQSTNSGERTVWVRRFWNTRAWIRQSYELFSEKFWNSSRLVQHWIVQLPCNDNHWLLYFSMRWESIFYWLVIYIRLDMSGDAIACRSNIPNTCNRTFPITASHRVKTVQISPP